MSTPSARPGRRSGSTLTRAGAALALALGLLAAGCQMGSSSSQSPGQSDQARSVQNAAPAPTEAAAPADAPTAAPEPTAAAPTAAPAGSGTGSVTTSAPAPDQGAAPVAGDFRTAVRAAAAKVSPAVVLITNEQVQTDQFNKPYTVPAGVGSGVIYDDQGHILTNNHVVEGAQRLTVALPDGTTFPAKLIGADPQTDLAVVQISGQNLPTAALGDSGKLQVGDWVVAIGNALGLPGGPTVSFGVVSALGRSVQEPGSTENSQGPYLFDVIQTDAPINPGNSGGPLINLSGEVIGINTLVAGQAEPGVQAQGIGFAIGIATARPIADQLVASGKVSHPFLGISYVPLNPVVRQQLGTDVKAGAVIAAVTPGSPAAQAGIQERDIITQVDGVDLASDSALAEQLNKHQPGETVTLTINRGGKSVETKVQLAERPAGP